MPATPIAFTSALPYELLTYILTHQAYPTTLIICQPRATFLSSLLNSIKHTSPAPQHLQEQEQEQRGPSSPSHPPKPFQPPERHPLLIPTLHQIAISRFLHLAFIPTVSHLRAYLSVFPPPSDKLPPDGNFDKPGKNNPLLVVYGILELHRDTSEWSAQGLGNTLAGLVEAGSRTKRRVVILEEMSLRDGGEVEVSEDSREDEERGEDTKKRVGNGWEERVPILSGSVRRAGFENEDGGWSGRTVEVGRILGRWFMFRRGDWDIEEAEG
jgi:hypothetical protein